MAKIQLRKSILHPVYPIYEDYFYTVETEDGQERRRFTFNEDENMLFKRIGWDHSTYFGWCEEAGAYVYYNHITGTFKGGITRGYSAVSSQVLSNMDIELIQNPKEIPEEEPQMTKDYIGDFNVVKVQFELDSDVVIKLYSYKIAKDIEVSVGDLMLVETAENFKVVKVVEYVENKLENSKEVLKANRWIVTKIDLTAHNARVKATEEYEFIKKNLEAKMKQMDEFQKYQLLAQFDPEAKKMMEQLGSLTGNTAMIEAIITPKETK